METDADAVRYVAEKIARERSDLIAVLGELLAAYKGNTALTTRTREAYLKAQALLAKIER